MKKLLFGFLFISGLGHASDLYINGSNPINNQNVLQVGTSFYVLLSSSTNSQTGKLCFPDGSCFTTASSGSYGPIFLSTMTAGATNFIFLQNVLQSGATFYVSSGTIQGQLTAQNIQALAPNNTQGLGVTGNWSGNVSGIVNYSTYAANGSALETISYGGISLYSFGDSTYTVPIVASVGSGHVGDLQEWINNNVVVASVTNSGLFSTSLGIKFPDGTIQVSSSPSFGDVILNQNSLQSGATFYVSSGSVAGTFYTPEWASYANPIGNYLSWNGATNILDLETGGSINATFAIASSGNNPAIDTFSGIVESDIANIGSYDTVAGFYAHGGTSTPLIYPFTAYEAEHSQTSTGSPGDGKTQQLFFGIQYGQGQDAYFFVGPSSFTTQGVYGPVYSNFVIDESSTSANFGNVGIGISTPTYPLSVNGTVDASTVIATMGMVDSGLANTVVYANANGVFVSTVITGGGGGSGTVTSVGSGYGLTGGPITTSGSLSLISNSTDYIQNTNSLQSGSTFYVSSGTVAGALSVSSITINNNAVFPYIQGDYLKTDSNGNVISGGGGPFIIDQNTLQSGATFYVSSGSIQGQLGFPSSSTSYFLNDNSGLFQLTNSSTSLTNAEIEGNANNQVAIGTRTFDMSKFSGLAVGNGIEIFGNYFKNGNAGNYIAFRNTIALAQEPMDIIADELSSSPPGTGLVGATRATLGSLVQGNLKNPSITTIFPFIEWGNEYGIVLRVQDGTNFTGVIVAGSTTSQSADIMDWRTNGAGTVGDVETHASINRYGQFMDIGPGYGTGVGSDNEAFGNMAGQSLSQNSTANTFMGYNTGNTVSSGTANSLFGTSAGQSMNGLANYNTGVGYLTLDVANSSGSTGVGYYALTNLSTGGSNTGIGYAAGYGKGTTEQATTTGIGNTYIGTNASQNNSAQISSATALGQNSLAFSSNTINLGGNGAFLEISTSAVTVSNCGTSTIVGSQWAGQVTVVGTPHNCNIVFPTNDTNAPWCFTASSSFVSVWIGSSTVSGFTVQSTTTLPTFNYQCIGYHY